MQSLADPIRCYYDCYDYYDDVRGNVVCSADPLGKLREPHLVYFITEEDWGGGGVEWNGKVAIITEYMASTGQIGD